MNTSELIRPVTDARGGITLDSQDGELLLLDRFVRGVLPLPPAIDPPLEAEPVLSLVNQFYTRIGTCPEIIAGGFVLHVPLNDVLENPVFRADLARVLTSFAQDSSIDLVIHFSHAPADWIPLLDWLFDVKKLDLLKDVKNRSIQVYVQGPFCTISDEIIKAAFDHVGTHLGFVIGWWAGTDGQPASSLRPDAISDLARFGFRIPVICYIHADNIDRIWSLVEEAVVLNQYSGFSLPLVCCHPEYTFAADQPALPEPDAYGKLLVHAFDDFPHYADICYPINELAGFIGSGGWNERWDVPARIHLLAKPDAGIGMFRHVPAFARAWIAWPELLVPEGFALVPFVLQRYRGAFPWAANPFCGRCQWRFTCGGTDGWDGRPDSAAAALKAICQHRMQLLELFTREKIGMMLPQSAAR